MRLCVHAGTLRGWGSASLGRGVVEGLSAEMPDVPMVVVHPRSWGALSLPGRDRTLIDVRPGISGKLSTELRLQFAPPSRFDTLLTLGDTGPLRPGVPHVLLLQQAHLAYRPRDWGYTAPRALRARFDLMAAYFRAGLGGVTMLTVQTEDMKRHVIERWGLEPGRIHVVPSAIDPFAELTERAIPSRSSRPTVCCIASAAAHKNHDVLPEFASRLRARVPDVRVVLSVLAENVPRVARRARELGCDDALEFRGPMTQQQVWRTLHESHVAVLPSQLESFGFHFFEAMACGCAIVAADRGFAREACGSAALYADARRPDDLADRVALLLTDESRRAEIAAAGVARVLRNRRSWSVVAGEYASLLRGIA